jgi:hypothetical protein
MVKIQKACAVLATAALFLPAAGCSRGRGSSSFDGIFEKLRKARTFDEARGLYTPGTIDALESAVREGVVTEKEKSRLLPLFNDKTAWEEVSKKSDGAAGTIRIRYTGHPVENMIGSEMEFRVRKEGGSWKIDLEDEIRQALRGRARGSTDEYIQRIKKGY